ncbi:MAG: metallophosphoesterase, partial [Myxococcota bacterium]
AAGPVLLVFGRGRFGLEAGEAYAAAVVGTALTLATIFGTAMLLSLDFLEFGRRGLLRLFGRKGAPEDGAKEADDAPATPAARERSARPAYTADSANAGGERTDGQRPEPKSTDASKHGKPFGRRRALASGGALLAAPTLSTYASTFGRWDYEIVEHVVSLPGLPRALDGFTLVQLSDIHVGAFVAESQLRAAVDRAGAAGGDLIVLTGDLLDHEARYAPRLGRLVRDLTPYARHGVAAILGNHDHYAGPEDVAEAVRGGGGRMLVNDGFSVEPGLAILGVDDLWARGNAGPDIDAALQAVDPTHARVLLCHQPAYFHDHAGVAGLQLSGHTHGGQIALGINPASLVLPHGYVRGRYEKNGAELYVNRGFGTAGPPARLGSPPEITKIVLTS